MGGSKVEGLFLLCKFNKAEFSRVRLDPCMYLSYSSNSIQLVIGFFGASEIHCSIL